jgi:hypothetical protein
MITCSFLGKFSKLTLRFYIGLQKVKALMLLTVMLPWLGALVPYLRGKVLLGSCDLTKGGSFCSVKDSFWSVEGSFCCCVESYKLGSFRWIREGFFQVKIIDQLKLQLVKFRIEIKVELSRVKNSEDLR